MYGEDFLPLHISKRRTLAEVWKVPSKSPNTKELKHINNTEEWKGKRSVGNACPRQLMNKNR